MHDAVSTLRMSGWRALAWAYVAIAVLAVTAALLPRLGALSLGIAVVILALPVMLALWHRGTVRRLERLHRFAPERWLHRWGARRMVGQVAGCARRAVLSLAVLLQSPWFGALEWGLLCAAVPTSYVVVACRCSRALPCFIRGPFTRPRPRGSLRAGQRSPRSASCGSRAGCSCRAPADLPVAEVTHRLQSAWPDVASGTVRWAIDGGAWAQAILATLGNAATVTWWRALLAVAVLPATVFGYATWMAAGAALDAAQRRRIFAASLTEADVPQPVGRRRAAAYVAAGLGGAVAAVAAFIAVDAAIGREERWLALRAVPQCERIGGTAYAIGTVASLRAYTSVLEDGMAARRAAACARLTRMAALAATNVDAYLDWYFSLGAEWMRIALMITGDVDTLLEVKFNRIVASDPRLAAVIAELEADQIYLRDVATAAQAGMGEVLAKQRLVLDERQCRDVTAAAAGSPLALPRYDDVRGRLLVGTVAGVAAGAFAGALTARAMNRATMHVAGKVLGRAVATRGVGRAGSAAAGAATGAVTGSVFPGAGTAIGAIAGAAAGLAVGAGADIAMLAIEEKLTREDMRRDLLASVDESLAPLRAAFGCAPTQSGVASPR